VNPRPARYAVIGSPVAHSLSPVMQQAAFAAMRIDALYEAIEATSDRVRDVFAQLRAQQYAGWNVTTPLKEAVMSLVDRASPEAAAARAANTIRAEDGGNLMAHNTDGAGFVRAVRELWSWEPGSNTVLILGTGPAARAIAIALRASGAVSLACWSRDAARAAQIAPPPGGIATLVVSALPADATLPPHIEQMSNDDTMIFDLNYGRQRSPVAGMRGRRRSDGLPLLLYQGALSFEWWTGLAAPLAQMRAALEKTRPLPE
jgi:shikimate dehydrogenase